MASTPKPSPFDNVPNELLSLIISFIPLDGTFSYKIDGSSRAIHQIIALMHVSRQFRVTILQHKVWHHIDFEFEDLAASTLGDFVNQLFPTTWGTDEVPATRKNLPTRIMNLCHVLFSDSYFRECIKTKTEWKISSLEVLFAMLAHSPTFTESARFVFLDTEGIDIALSRMRECKSIVRLDVRGPNDRVLALDSFHRYFPLLKILRISLADDLTGSLADVEGLDEFTLDGSGIDNHLDLTELLPIASAETLSRLSFIDFDCELYGVECLNWFTNLKYLHAKRMYSNTTLFSLMNPLPNCLVSLKVSMTVQSQSLYTPVLGAEFDLNLAFLNCLCVARLNTISLEIHCGGNDMCDDFASNYIGNCMQVVTGMVGKLRYLEDVEIWGGLDVGGVHILGQLQKLKRLRWVISEDRYVKGKGSQDLTSQVVEVFTQIGKEMESVKVEIVP